MPADIANGESGSSVRTKLNTMIGNSTSVPYPNGITLSGGADVLSIYEEDTWDPTFADAETGGNTTTTGTGHYTRIGNIITVWWSLSNISTVGLTAGNDAFIQGLPYPSSLSSSGTCELDTVDYAASSYVLPVLFGNITSAIRFTEITDNTANDFLIVSQFTSGTSDITKGCLTYKI